MSRILPLTVLAGLGLAAPVYCFLQIQDQRTKASVAVSFFVSIIAFVATRWLIPIVASKTEKRGIFGKDLNKKGTELGDVPVPEAAGLAPGCIFLLCVISFELMHYYDIMSVIQWVGSGFKAPLQREVILDAWLVDYNAALSTIGFMLFLGFVDDVLDVRWRVKLILPFFAALPLVVAYSGGTGIAVPKPLQAVGLPSYVELGILYRIYMVMLAIFSSNSINILAGVNGVEAGQSFVIACAIITHNLWELATSTNQAARDGHMFSAFLMFPFAATTLGLLSFNWFPSKVFVGDTYTYFAGMTIAVAGILGHFSETLLLFLLPQIFNFLYSCPQLFGYVFCPRHRLPVFDPKTRLLTPKPAPDWNVVNLMLQLTGDCTEQVLCIRILIFQALCCIAGFAVRWLLTGIYK